MNNIAPNPQEVILRNYTVFFGTANFGLVKEVKLRFEPIKDGPDLIGRYHTIGYKFRAEWIMMQNTKNAMKEIADHVKNDQFDSLKFYNQDAEEYGSIDYVKPNYEPNIDGNGKAHGIKCIAEKILDLEEYYSFFSYQPSE